MIVQELEGMIVQELKQLRFHWGYGVETNERIQHLLSSNQEEPAKRSQRQGHLRQCKHLVLLPNEENSKYILTQKLTIIVGFNVNADKCKKGTD